MQTVGLVPAGGRGTRLLPFRYPKELFPIVYSTNNGRSAGMRVVCQDAFDCLLAASISRAYVIISDHKFEITRFLSDGREFGIDLAYLHQREVCGLANAVDCAYPWVAGSNVALVLPDTIIEPQNSIARIRCALEDSGADAVLAVFPTREPGELCPVEFEANGRIRALHDKDGSHGIMNTWGAAVWAPRFTEFLHAYLQDHDACPAGVEVVLSDVFLAASRSGLTMLAVPISNGRFVDIGRGPALMEAREVIENRVKTLL